MALLTPAWMQASVGDSAIQYTALQDRAGVLGAVFSREGVLSIDGNHLKIGPRAAGANYSIDIAIGRAAIQGDDVSDQGMYLCTSTTIINISTYSTGGAIAKPASGTRRHRVIARVRDKLHLGSGPYDWLIEVLQDTGSGAPAQPNSAITLGFLNMTSTMTAITATEIEDARTAASVGTPDRTGVITPSISAYNPSDATRPLRVRVTPEGWVLLSGWCTWNAANQPLTAGTWYELGSVPAIAQAAGIRDFLITSSLTANPAWHAKLDAGKIWYRPPVAVTLTTGWWWSFDGAIYTI